MPALSLALFLAATPPEALPAAPDSTLQILKSYGEEKRLALAAAALQTGNSDLAATLLELPGSKHPFFRHRREILAARIAASRGKWSATGKILRDWKSNPERREGSGETLFWLGWVALHQGRPLEADSLFVLASAYTDEPASQLALEYRFAGLSDTGASLFAYVRGLPESPLPLPERLLALQSVSAESPLFPQSRWEKACLLEGAGSKDSAIAILGDLSRDLGTLAGRKAAARLAYLTESTAPDSALAAYERLLLEYQQGVRAEFSRGRIRSMRKANP